jgi:hypothetical protein
MIQLLLLRPFPGVYLCGVCGDKLSTARPQGRASKRVYPCRPAVHLARSLDALDGLH